MHVSWSTYPFGEGQMSVHSFWFCLLPFLLLSVRWCSKPRCWAHLALKGTGASSHHPSITIPGYFDMKLSKIPKNTIDHLLMVCHACIPNFRPTARHGKSSKASATQNNAFKFFRKNAWFVTVTKFSTFCENGSMTCGNKTGSFPQFVEIGINMVVLLSDFHTNACGQR